uniref:DRBM domain-containing protein n=1 Tax=Favella ehrenbergii TaxID=182087 RepID=A0A7S3I153_9SPIT|mmetsp:Transcript_2481/g.3128  ORF Transcript_2481/g.3128 Transcript_2481/m.3128 type:complete len:102 (+) Transcript_2481:1301-1606(+)|eukprot:CAMPEP_0170458448 /NCGR_PEP_ID=MMETSP0123-20130129/5415_1 /TAXON_ID=182087 /ORGANISM="Favella ehrenbergii, Strain Fehren 1" /LENGTH=101 /DNA_ID=CAMNT_0010722601 /DNA_START=920 /DNA_END=1225 /DNA_ORIENTATION=-
MTEGFGNSRKQAERNASINGLRWLKEKKLLDADAASSSGMGVHHNPLEQMTPAAFNASAMQAAPVMQAASASQLVVAAPEMDGDDIEMTHENLSDHEESKL